MLFCFSNALHSIIVFTMNNSLPSEEIHDSLCSQTTRPWGNPISSPVLVFHFPKAAWASLCLAHTVIGQGDAFSFCVARRDAPPVPLSELVPAPLLLRADSGQYLRDFIGGGQGREGSFSSHTASRIWAQVLQPSSQVKNRFLLQIKICIWRKLQQY